MAIAAFRTLELMKYHTHVGESGTSVTAGSYAMNIETFNSLPPDLQKIILDNSKIWEEEMIEITREEELGGMNAAKEAGHTFIDLTPEEIKLWYDLAKPVHEKYLEENASAGPIKAIYDRLQEMIEEQK